MSSETEQPADTSSVKKPKERSLWQIIAAVLGEPVMRSVDPKSAADEDEEETPGPSDLSDLYPPTPKK